MKVTAAGGLGARGTVDAARSLELGRIGMKSLYHFECRDRNGAFKWAEEIENLVVNAGLNDLLDKYFKGSTYTAAWYVGLKGAGTIAAGDTMGSHGGWSEVTAYDESVRQTLTLGSVSSQSVDNTGSKAVFTASGSATVAGAFVTSNSTKGGTSGTLYGAADFGSSRSVEDGDTLTVTITLTAAAA